MDYGSPDFPVKGSKQTRTFDISPVFYFDYDQKENKFGLHKCHLELQVPTHKDAKARLERIDEFKRVSEGDPPDDGVYFMAERHNINCLSGRPELFILDLYNHILVKEDFIDDDKCAREVLRKSDYQSADDPDKTYFYNSKMGGDNVKLELNHVVQRLLSNFAELPKSVRKMKKVSELYEYIRYLYAGLPPIMKFKMYTNQELYQILIMRYHKDPDFELFWCEIYQRGDKKPIEKYVLESYLTYADYSKETLQRLEKKYVANFYEALNFCTGDEDMKFRRLQKMNKYYDQALVIPDLPLSHHAVPVFDFVVHILKQKPTEVCRVVKDLLHEMCDKLSIYRRQMYVSITNILNQNVDNSLALLLFVKNFDCFLRIIEDEPPYGHRHVYHFAVILEQAYEKFKDRVKVPRGFVQMILRLDRQAKSIYPGLKYMFEKEPDKIERINKVFDITLGISPSICVV